MQQMRRTTRADCIVYDFCMTFLAVTMLSAPTLNRMAQADADARLAPMQAATETAFLAGYSPLVPRGHEVVR